MRVTVLGGGGFRVPLIHRALLASGVAVDEIVLQDVDASRLAVILSVLGGDGPVVRRETSLEAAVDGAGLVIAALRVGGTAGRVRDERVALDAGVLGQETVGAGGLRYAVRGLPVARDVAAVIARRAPDAWTITMTNPAGMITQVMRAELGDRVVGVCDSPTSLARRVCVAAGIDPGPSLAEVAGRVSLDYVGLNHLGWLRALVVDGADRLPALLAAPERVASFEEGALFGPDVLVALRAVPNEYLYWYYAATEALAGVRAAGRTRGEHVAAEQDRFYAAAADAPASATTLWQAANDERNRSYFAELRDGERDEADVAVGGYETITAALASALTGMRPARLILGVANGAGPHGELVPGLPADTVVEVPCDVDATGVRPVAVGPPSTHQLGLMASVAAAEQAIITAALTGSPEAALRAYLLHPLVTSVAAARQLAAEAMDGAAR